MIEVENIGYDAIGKNIDGNQLLEVATRINRFICTIEQISTDYVLMIYIYSILFKLVGWTPYFLDMGQVYLAKI